MNAHVHPDPNLSATLASLSLAARPGGPPPPRRRGGRLPLLLVTLAVLASGAAYALLPLGVVDDGLGRPGAEAAPAPVVDPHAQTGGTPSAPSVAIPRAVTGSGHVVALIQASVHARRGGTVVELGADIGTRVAVGQVLARLDDPDLRFAVRAADLARDKTRLELQARRLDAREAEAAARRAKTLSANGALSGQVAQDSASAAERAGNLAAQAESDLAEAELAVSRAVQSLDELTVRAPVAGIVTARDARLGEATLAQVDARGDAPLFTIADPDRLALDTDVAETALANVEVGQRGEAVLDAYPDRPFAVAVTRIAPVASAERGTVVLRLSIPDPPPGIRPAMAVRVTLRPTDDPAFANQDIDP